MKLKSLLFSGLLLVPLFIAGQPGETVQADQAPQGQSELDKIKDLSNYQGAILVNKETRLWKANPEMTRFTQEGTRSLAANTAWYTNTFYVGSTESGDICYFYRVSPNEWIRTGYNTITPSNNQATPEYDSDTGAQKWNAKVVTINNRAAPVYDDYGHKTGKTEPAHSQWLVDQHFMLGYSESDPNGKVFQRIGVNQWINLTDDASVTQLRIDSNM
ncbi:hypothetical protein [Companilactobacillus sp.]|uniref:hypothetical protein n=1 Tax=Companilactobacillus sp. TaxID=2767905 RepID=UPI00261CFCF1|nr:hypothetical protein [Companilactobacillus sp.]